MKRTLALVLAVLLALSTIALAESTELELQTIVLSKEKDNGEITLAVGEQRQIDPAFATANGWTVTEYKSSKAEAVTVDGNGLLTACAEGKAKITVKTDNKKKAKIKVKVIDPYKPDNISIAQGKEITLAVGQSVQLGAVLSPATAQTTLEWKSSKGKYVTVDGSGVVYAAAEGSAKITVKTHNKKKATIKVKVVDPYKPDKVSILQGKNVTITMDQAVQLTAVLSPETAQTTLTWTSNKPGIAVVDGNGLVEPVSEGTATITVQTQNKKKARIKVKVTNPYKPTGVAIAQGKEVTLNGGGTLQLIVSLEPATAQTNLTWTSSKPSVATVDGGGLVTAVGNGCTTITVKTANGKKATCKVTVQVQVQPREYVEMSEYVGKDINAFANEFGLKTEKGKWSQTSWDEGTTFYYINNSDISIDAFRSAGIYEISNIQIYSRGCYYLYGIRPGDDQAEAIEKLKAYFRNNPYASYYGEDDRFTVEVEEPFWYWAGLYFENGKVKEVCRVETT